MPLRTFTPEQANAALAVVRPLVERLVGYRADQLAVEARGAELAAHVGGNGGGLDPAVPAALVAAGEAAEEGLRETLERLDELGVVVKDLDAGLVDFPSERDGRTVLLCWQLGEDSVAWWHDLDTGFAGRQPL